MRRFAGKERAGEIFRKDTTFDNGYPLLLMHTSVPLSPDNRRIIQQVQKQDQLNALIPFLIGIFVVAFPCVLLVPSLAESTVDIEPVLMVLALTGLGIFIGYRAKLKRRKIDELYASVLNTDKLVVSGVLKHVSIVYDQYVKYTLDNYSVQAYVPLATHPGKSYDYKRELATIDAVTNVQVSLHMATIKPGVILLLEAMYEPAANKTIVLSVEGAEGKKALRKFCRTTTTVCEVLTAWIERGRFPYPAKWYRLGNGMIIHYDGRKLNCGDMLVVDYIEKENGEWAELVDIIKSPVKQWL